jgi:uncharacterized damage-inducible protein DinB
MVQETNSAVVRAKGLAGMYDISSFIVRVNSDGLTHEESLQKPGKEGNPANWVLGHIVYYRNEILDILGGERVWEEPAGSFYEGSKDAENIADQAFAWTRLRDDFEISDAALKKALRDVDAGSLDVPYDKRGNRLDRIEFLFLHETYHGGQLGLLRRILGKPGALF